MDTQRTIGVMFGGLVVAVLGGIAEYTRDKTTFPNYKGLVRDFIIGSILVLFLLQVLPESTSSVLSFLPSIKSLTDSLPSMQGGSVEPDLQVGPARF